MQPQLLLEPPDAEPGRVGRHDEGADLGRAVVAGTGSGGHDVGARLPGIGDEALAAVQDPGPAVRTRFEASGRPRSARIAAGARLGQPVGADDLPDAIGTRNRCFCSAVPARWSGPQPRLVWAATISPSEPQTRPISSIAIA